MFIVEELPFCAVADASQTVHVADTVTCRLRKIGETHIVESESLHNRLSAIQIIYAM